MAALSFSRLSGVRSSTCLLVTLTFSGCGGCGGGSGGGGGGLSAPPAGPSGETTNNTGTVGEIKPDAVNNISTDNGALIRELEFTTGTSSWAGRYTTEYLIAIRAIEPSCVRLTMRPTFSDFDSDDEDSQFSCTDMVEEQQTEQEQEEAEAETDESEDGEDAAGEDGAEDAGAEEEGIELHLVSNQDGLRLAEASAPLCSGRIFRMPLASQPNAPVAENTFIEKTGRLITKGSKVRIWLDEEYARPCIVGGGSLDQLDPISFGPYIQAGGGAAGEADQLRDAHFTTLAANMDKIFNQMTADFGAVSDLDESGFVEIFVSPDVNRSSFVGTRSLSPDHFRANYIFRPRDLEEYHPRTNPGSNEGEVVYLWSPDPAGIYNIAGTPTSTSLTSNYARGHLAAQLLNLIYLNGRIVEPTTPDPDEPWLVESIAMLASAYYAGNDFSKMSLAAFMTSRPQHVSLTSGDHIVEPAEYSFVGDDASGMRTMFGWYLHSQVCGETGDVVCTDLYDLMTSDQEGPKNVEALLGGREFKDVLTDFAIALGVSLADSPTTALSAWDNLSEELKAAFPAKPTVLPKFAQVFSSNPHNMQELELTPTSGVVEIRDDVDTVDRTQAAPIPSYDMLMYQVLSSDEDIEFQMAKDSTVFLLITGLVDQTTRAVAALGKGLNVTFIPLGDRNLSKRHVIFEQVSENAHADQRPLNLTRHEPSDATVFTTYRYAPAYDPDDDSYDLTVTDSRDLWVLGGIENYQEIIEGSFETVGDVDSYNISINPCEGLSGNDLTDCQAEGTYSAIVQVYIRDAANELAPMLVLTDTERALFRGYAHLGLVADVDPEYDTGDDSIIPVFCNSLSDPALATATFDEATEVVTAANHGLSDGDLVFFTAAQASTAFKSIPEGLAYYRLYKVDQSTANDFELLTTANVAIDFTTSSLTGTDNTYYLHSGNDDDLLKCSAGGVVGETLLSDYVTQGNYNDSGQMIGWAHNFVNYLAMGPRGFPFTTLETVTYEDAGARSDRYDYRRFEADWQFPKFSLKDLTDEIFTYTFVTTLSWAQLDEESEPLSDDILADLFEVMDFMQNCAADPDPDTESGAAVITACTGFSDLLDSQCEALCLNQVNLANIIRADDNVSTGYLPCRGLSSCDNRLSLVNHYRTAQGNLLPPLISPDRLVVLAASTESAYSTYQPPVPVRGIAQGGSNQYCSGAEVSENQFVNCWLQDPSSGVDELRHMFFTEASRVSMACRGADLGGDTDVCVDVISSSLELDGDDGVFVWSGEALSTDRTLLRPANIHHRAGEIIGKPYRLQYGTLEVPSNQESVVNVMIGGRKQSEGEYLLRVRIK